MGTPALSVTQGCVVAQLSFFLRGALTTDPVLSSSQSQHSATASFLNGTDWEDAKTEQHIPADYFGVEVPLGSPSPSSQDRRESLNSQHEVRPFSLPPPSFSYPNPFPPLPSPSSSTPLPPPSPPPPLQPSSPSPSPPPPSLTPPTQTAPVAPPGPATPSPAPSPPPPPPPRRTSRARRPPPLQPPQRSRRRRTC